MSAVETRSGLAYPRHDLSGNGDTLRNISGLTLAKGSVVHIGGINTTPVESDWSNDEDYPLNSWQHAVRRLELRAGFAYEQKCGRFRVCTSDSVADDDYGKFAGRERCVVEMLVNYSVATTIPPEAPVCAHPGDVNGQIGSATNANLSSADAGAKVIGLLAEAVTFDGTNPVLCKVLVDGDGGFGTLAASDVPA